jgi:plastocyanin
MRVFPTRLALCALVLAALLCPAPEARSGGHCMAGAESSPIAGRIGWFAIRSAAGRTDAHWPTVSPESATPAYVIRALDHGWDAGVGGQTATDTLVVPAGSTVRWLRVSGIHTLTSGRGADDPDAGSKFDYLLDDQHPLFDSTFTNPDTVRYFCFFHDPLMRGVLVVTSSAGVLGDPHPTRLAFTAPPRPNPSRSAVSFNVGLPREQNVRIEVVDLLGARVAVLHDGALEAGDHRFRWNGLTERGDPARAGVYVVVLRSGAMMMSRSVSLLR